MKSAVSVTKLPLIWQFLSSRIRRSPTGAVCITYALTSRRRCFRNSIARGGSRFPRKRRYAQMWGAGAKCDFACASNYNLPPSLREVSRLCRDGGSSCPPCAREGGAVELRQKGCLAVIRCKRRHLLCLLRPNLPLTRLLRKGEMARAKMLRFARHRGKPNEKRKRTLGFPKSHDFFFHQFERKSVNKDKEK